MTKFEAGKKYFFGKKGFLAGGHWNYGNYGFYTVIARTAKFITVQSSHQYGINEDTQEMAYEVSRIKIYPNKKGDQEMALVSSGGIYANDIHEDTPENNDISKW